MVSEFVRSKEEDGQNLGACVARPASEPVAGLVGGQQTLGVNRPYARWPMAMQETGS